MAKNYIFNFRMIINLFTSFFFEGNGGRFRLFLVMDCDKRGTVSNCLEFSSGL